MIGMQAVDEIRRFSVNASILHNTLLQNATILAPLLGIYEPGIHFMFYHVDSIARIRNIYLRK